LNSNKKQNLKVPKVIIYIGKTLQFFYKIDYFVFSKIIYNTNKTESSQERERERERERELELNYSILQLLK
jgi:hypothetical protein